MLSLPGVGGTSTKSEGNLYIDDTHNQPPGTDQAWQCSQERSPLKLKRVRQRTQMDQANSIVPTSHSSSLEPPSSSSSYSSTSIVAEFHRLPESPHRGSVHKGPHISNLGRKDITTELSLEDQPDRGRSSERDIVKRNRYTSTSSSVRAQSRFTSPDRYTAWRRHESRNESPIQTVHMTSSLKGRERYERRRDDSMDPFGSTSRSRSRQTTVKPIGVRSQHFAGPPHYTPSFVHGVDASPVHVDAGSGDTTQRQISPGNIWSVGGRAAATGQVYGIDVGLGGLLMSGSTVPMMHPQFLDVSSKGDKIKDQERRLALALDIDQARRILQVGKAPTSLQQDSITRSKTLQWRDGHWTRDYGTMTGSRLEQPSSARPEKAVPAIAFRVLDAPRLKDDYYCTVLAYSQTCRTLAVALAHRVYLWTEHYGVRYPPLPPARPTNYVTSLAFSSSQGEKAILAIARSNGQVMLWSLLEQAPRFNLEHCCAACCVSFRPVLAHRQTAFSTREAICEDLLVGDDSGQLYYYSVEWPSFGQGTVTLIAKLEAHSQNICGLAWCPDGRAFVTGGNDNSAALFVVNEILQKPVSNRSNATKTDTVVDSVPQLKPSRFTPGQQSQMSISVDEDSIVMNSVGLDRDFSLQGSEQDRGRRPDPLRLSTTPLTPPCSPLSRSIGMDEPSIDPSLPGITGTHKHMFRHSAAVKAIAFAPWQTSLLATGGGSNDRQIHFHHIESGSKLAVINVFAQVTSLVWSTTRREIAATFGYAQPEHEFRVAVFAWPSCECVVSIPWERKSNGEIGRALWAIPYPGGPNDTSVDRASDIDGGLNTWESVRRRELRLRNQQRNGLPTPEPSPEHGRARHNDSPGARRQHHGRAEGEAWASRTEDEGSLIIACCDQTVKFFEIWAGRSKGNGAGLGSTPGVLGGSKILEGYCEDVGIHGIGHDKDVIR